MNTEYAIQKIFALQRELFFFFWVLHSCIIGDLGERSSGDLTHLSVFLEDGCINDDTFIHNINAEFWEFC